VDLTLNEAQRMLQQAARDFLEREAPKETIVRLMESDTGLPDGLWQTAAELGWLGMLVPPELGGSGNELTDVAVLFEELGKGPLPGPFFQSAVLGALTVLEGGTPAQRERLLPQVATGREVLAAAITEPDASWGPQGVRLAPTRRGRDGRYILSGVKLFVPDAPSATRFSPSTLRSDIRVAGLCCRRFMLGSRSVPPAISMACGPSAASMHAASATLFGA